MKAKIFLSIFLLISPLTTAIADIRLDKIGTQYIVFSESDGFDNEIYICKKDSGDWLAKEKLTDNDAEDFSPSICLDKDGNPWVVWAGNDGISTSIYSRHWDGKKWSEITQVDSVDLFSDTFPCIVIDSKNIPYVVWSGGDGKDDDIYISSWYGSRWSSEVMVNLDDDSPDLMPIVTEWPNGNGLIISWMGYNGRNYELYYTLYKKGKICDEKGIGIKKTYSFGDCPYFIKSESDSISVCWWERDKCLGVQGDGINWSNEQEIDLRCRDPLILDLLNRLKTPIWIAWCEDGLNQSLRLVPIEKSKVFVTVPRANPYVSYSMFDTSAVCKPRASDRGVEWVDIFISSAYADTVSSPTKYIAFGDSITGDQTGPTYSPKLEQKLNERIGPSTVVNEGVGGERTFEGLDRIDGILNGHSAQYLLLMEGTNDVSYNYSTESIIFNLGQMIDRAVAFGTRPLIAQLTPRLDSLDGRIRDEINPAIVNLATQKEVICVDQYKEMSKDVVRYMSDDKHPNDEGYELMSQIWFNAINDMLNPPEEGNEEGCGAVTLPVYKNNGNGPNLMILAFILVLLFLYRIKLCRSY